MTRLDHNRSVGELAGKLGTTAEKIRNVTIWGNHSNTQVPDASNAIYDSPEGPKKVADLLPAEYLQNEFVTKISTRGGAVIKARGLSSAASAANAAIGAVRDWYYGTQSGNWVSLAIPVPPDSPYGIKPGLIFSFPVSIDTTGTPAVVKGLPVTPWLQAKLDATEAELVAERDTAFKVLNIE
jgi:malate/lactate dehydrogenase